MMVAEPDILNASLLIVDGQEVNELQGSVKRHRLSI
jgi:hypothetical protein